MCVCVCFHLSMRAMLVSASSRKSSSGDSTMPLGMYRESRRTFTLPVWGSKVSRRPRSFSSMTFQQKTGNSFVFVFFKDSCIQNFKMHMSTRWCCAVYLPAAQPGNCNNVHTYRIRLGLCSNSESAHLEVI